MILKRPHEKLSWLKIFVVTVSEPVQIDSQSLIVNFFFKDEFGQIHKNHKEESIKTPKHFFSPIKSRIKETSGIFQVIPPLKNFKLKKKTVN